MKKQVTEVREKVEYTEDFQTWRKLILAILERSIYDLDGRSTSVCTVNANSKARIIAQCKGDSSHFLNSEYAELMCSCIGLDVTIIRKARGLNPEKKIKKRKKTWEDIYGKRKR